ncbi:hypothetical protein K3495_g140 [Podosphaera aphanis]|nr:hypothetical protein K3495_g140 [Podosphaera aphanis]
MGMFLFVSDYLAVVLWCNTSDVLIQSNIIEQSSLELRSLNVRSRSNTAASSKSRQRPLSRASTASVRSGTAQSLVDQIPDPTTASFHRHWYEQNSHPQQRFGNLSHQMASESVYMQPQHHLHNTREYEIDPALGNTPHNNVLYHQEAQYRPNMGRQPTATEIYGANFVEGNAQMLEARSDEHEDLESVASRTKKSSKTSAANELEMRQLFQANKHRSLPDVAAELHGNERGPQSERQRQVFAMLWINQVCHKGKGSVPRGRVYSNYVSRCATERVTVLNPASFGKLVRVLFPGLKTRRLGVRGESKYHYVNFSLEDDQPGLTESQKNPTPQTLNNSQNFVQNFTLPSQSPYPVEKVVLPSTDIPQVPDAWPQQNESFLRSHSLYCQPDIVSISQLESSNSKVPQHLRFIPSCEQMATGDEPIALPKIASYIPAGTDPDSASALNALYRSHCTSLVDALRFCKEKTFFHLFTSFHGTLTMPVQKLFLNPEMAPWIEECDLAMYQKMMRVVAPLTLQVAPKPVLDTLRNISECLVSHIQNCFQGHPEHVLRAKVSPATLFAGILDRELRVNLTAHAAANMLSNPANRDQMYEEWITMVRTRKIAECVPTSGMDDVVNLLLTELRDLLNPISVDWELESRTLYGKMALRSGRQQQSSTHPDSTTENVLDRWVNFLASLPERFPRASHAEIVRCVQSVGTAVMRDITISQGKSFGAWWVTKCWIDEMIAFMAEQGGFMECSTPGITRQRPGGQPTLIEASSHRGSRYSSGSDELLKDNNTQIPNSVSHQMEIISQNAINTVANHDDSGIGLRTPDDDYVVEKYEYNQTEHLNTNGLEHPGLSSSAMG